MDQIAQMDLIYLHACLTIVAGDGVDSNAGLSGFLPGSRSFNQNVVEIAGLRFISCTAPILKAFDAIKWHSRAWTYQEFMLSKRLLVFSDQQVYYNCNLQSYSEDSLILNKTQEPLTQQIIQEGQLWKHPDFIYDTRLQINSARAIFNSDRWHSYMTLVEDITVRGITMQADILRSVTGVLSSMTKYTGEEFVCGLPSSLLEAALMWQPLAPLQRRGATYSGHPFPSWSWTGWDGPMCYAQHYSPFSVFSIIHNWELLIPRDSNRTRRSDSTDLLEWTHEEVIQNFIPYSPATLKETHKNAGDYRRTSWRPTPRASISRSSQPTAQKQGKLKSFFKKLATPSSSSSAPIPTDSSAPTPSLFFESALLHFPGYTKVLFIDPTPTPFFHKHLQKHTTGVFRIINHAQQWVGTIHLPLPLPFGSAIAPVSAEFLAIALSYDSFEDTNKINPGPNIGQNTFDTKLWATLNLPANEVRMMNVLWIRWVDGIAQRLGAGQIHRDAWAVGDVMSREIWLG